MAEKRPVKPTKKAEKPEKPRAPRPSGRPTKSFPGVRFDESRLRIRGALDVGVTQHFEPGEPIEITADGRCRLGWSRRPSNQSGRHIRAHTAKTTIKVAGEPEQLELDDNQGALEV